MSGKVFMCKKLNSNERQWEKEKKDLKENFFNYLHDNGTNKWDGDDDKREVEKNATENLKKYKTKFF